MNFEVRLTAEAEHDLLRLYDFIVERELQRGGDLGLADRALSAVRDGIATLRSSPFTCRKAGREQSQNPFMRELVIAFGHAGYVALFEVVDPSLVVIAAVRHQREDDYN